MELLTRIALAAALVFAFLHGRVVYSQGVLPFVIPENTLDPGNLSLDPDALGDKFYADMLANFVLTNFVPTATPIIWP